MEEYARATANGQNGKVRSLTKLLLKSYSNLLTSVRQITQINTGKQTAGVDGQIALTLLRTDETRQRTTGW